jgi:hypothetical protein
MKTYLVLSARILRFGLAIGVVCSPAVGSAAEKPLEAPAATTDWKPAGYDLQIVGGRLIRPDGKVEATLPNVVDALRERYTNANIIFSAGLAKLKVDDLKLRAGRLVEDLEALRIATGERFDVQAPNRPFPPQVDPNTGQVLYGVNSGLFVLRESTPPAQRQRLVEAFNIGPYLEWLRHQPKEPNLKGSEEDYGPQEIQMMIKETLGGFRPDGAEADQPVFQYHPGTSLLIVIGNPDSVEIARKIVKALPGMNPMEESRAGSSAAILKERERAAAEDAFRKRYGLAPRSALPALPAPVPPDPESSK